MQNPPDSQSDRPEPEPIKKRRWLRRRFFWQGKVAPAFWTFASILSLIINILLIVTVLMLAGQLFEIKAVVGDQLLGGLYENFAKMDSAHIKTTIRVTDTIQVQDTIQVVDVIQVVDTLPVVFPLALQQETGVVLTRDTPVRGATVMLNGTGVTTDLVLRKGTKLNIYLDMTIPVSQTVPVNLTVPLNLKVPVNLSVPVDLMVPVDIPLAQTELHEPFVGLQDVVRPYYTLLQDLPNSWSDIFCEPLPESFCK